VPLTLTLYCVFNPPEFLLGESSEFGQWGLFAWLAVWTILSRSSLTLYSVPHMALGGELSKNQHQRSQLFSANTVFAYVAGASFGFAAWSFFFAGEHARAADGLVVPGHLAAEAYGPLILTGVWSYSSIDVGLCCRHLPPHTAPVFGSAWRKTV
jgi:Na+/melibiose symporter-like transporter